MTSLSPHLRQHGPARLHVTPHALGTVRQQRLPCQQRVRASPCAGLYSTFRNWGQKWVYALERRRRARREHRLAPPRLRRRQPGWQRPAHDQRQLAHLGRLVRAVAHAAIRRERRREVQVERTGHQLRLRSAWPTTDPNIPQFSASCFTPGATNVRTSRTTGSRTGRPASVGESAQLNLAGRCVRTAVSAPGNRIGTLEFGGKYRDAQKYDDSYTTTYTVVKGRDDSDCASSPGASPTRTTTTRRIRGRCRTSTTRSAELRAVASAAVHRHGGPGPNALPAST